MKISKPKVILHVIKWVLLMFAELFKLFKPHHKKFTAVLLALITIAPSFPAFALTEGSSYSYTERYLNAYYDTGTWQTANGHTHNNYGQVQLRNLKSTGEPLYCIQIYNECDGSAATARDIEETNVWKYELNDGQQGDIRLVSIYGYPNYSYGCSATEAQLATQVLIWEIETHQRTDFGSGCSSSFKRCFNNYSDALTAYNGILESCRNHSVRPDFGTTSITINGKGTANAITLTDKNGVLSNFNVSLDNSNVGLKVEGNNLIVAGRVDGIYSGIITLTKNKTDINSAFALTGANQTLFYGTLSDPVQTRIRVNVDALPSGDLVIHKTAEDGILEGHVFRVQGEGGYDKTVKTDKEGKATFKDITGNSYVTVTEILSDDSQYASMEPFQLWITSGETRDFNLSNKLKRGTLWVTKVDSETGENIIEGDGVFKCQQWSNTADNFIDYKDLTYDENLKKYVVDDLVVTADNSGLFKCVEVKAPTGYVSSNPDGYKFKIYRDGQTVDLNSGKIENIIQKIRVHLEKRGEVLTSFSKEDTEYGFKFTPIYEVQNIPDAIYEFKAAEDIIANGKTVYSAGDVADTITTTISGADTIELYPGKYTYQELQAPEGYVLDETVYEIELTYKEDETNLYTEIITADDDRQKLEVSLQKQLEKNPYFQNETAYQDIIFGVFLSEDILNNSEDLLLSKNSLVDLISIDETLVGKSAIDFPVNTKWYIKELKTAPEYNLNTDVFEFEFTTTDQNISLIQLELNNGDSIENILKRGKIEGLKTDNNNNPLESVLIGLFMPDETEFTTDTALITVTSDKSGKFVFNNLPIGTYKVKELSSPEGYEIDETVYEAIIADEGSVFNLTIVNKIIIGTMELRTSNSISPKTGNYDGVYVPWIIAGFTLSAITILIHLKKGNKKCED